MEKFLTKRNIFILLSVVILAEVIWAGWTLFKPTPPPELTTQSAVVQSKPVTITLQSPKTQLSVGEKFTVSINIFSDKLTDGTDLIILYDPKILSVEGQGTAKVPVLLGTLYSDYPINKLDDTAGRITVSGISNKPGGVNPSGLFGSVIFQAKSPGLAKISLDFTAGSTADTNVTETGSGKDVLEKVNNLEIKIQ